MVRAVGIDVSERRGLDLAVIDDRALRHVYSAASVNEAVRWIDRLDPAPAVIGIDAPQGYRLPIMANADRRAALAPPPPTGRYLRYRVCDYELARRGIGLYLTPTGDEPVPGWIDVGFTLFSELQQRRYVVPSSQSDVTASLLEVYPYASFVTLNGSIPPAKSTDAGLTIRRCILRDQGVHGLPVNASHDTLDSLVAALTAAIWAEGNGCTVGDVDEGLIVLPVTMSSLRDHYSRARH